MRIAPMLSVQPKLKTVSALCHCIFAQTVSGDLYVWGRNNYGQLGLGDTNNQTTPQKHPFFTDKPLDFLICSAWTVVAVTSDGEGFVWGANATGQLGLGVTSNFEPRPQRCPFFTGKVITTLACGSNFIFAITNQREVYAWGNNSYGQLGLGHTTNQISPILVPFWKDKHIAHIACGDCHAMVVTETREVYSWGQNNNGQLGIGNTVNQYTPTRINFFYGKIVTHMACGYSHSIIATANKELYVWGRNGLGQLGLGHNTDHHVPQRNVFFDGRPIAAVVCGADHNLVVMATGEVYVWGFNKYGQLGLGHNTNVNTPTLSSLLSHKPLVSLASGFNHVAMVTAAGEVLVCGANANGELGLGHTADQNAPTTVGFFSGKLLAWIQGTAQEPEAVAQQESLQKLQRDFLELFESGELADCAVSADGPGGRTFPLHRAILANRCPALLACCWTPTGTSVMHSGGWAAAAERLGAVAAVEPVGVTSSRALQQALQYVYIGNCKVDQLSFAELFEIVRFSEKFGLKHSLGRLVQRELIRRLSVDTIAEFVAMARAANREEELRWAAWFITTNYAHLPKGVIDRLEHAGPPLSQLISAGVRNTEAILPPPFISPPPNTLGEDMKSMFQRKDGCDFTVVFGNHSFPAHQCVLYARCPFFNAMLRSSLREKSQGSCVLRDIDMPFDAFQAMMRYLYTGTAEFTLEQCVWVLAQAPYFGIDSPELVDHCFAFVEKEMTLENCLILLQQAHDLGVVELKQKVLQFIATHYGALAEQLQNTITDHTLLIHVLTRVTSYLWTRTMHGDGGGVAGGGGGPAANGPNPR